MLQQPEQRQPRQGVHAVACVDGLCRPPNPPERVAVGPPWYSALHVVVNLREVIDQLHGRRAGNSGFQIASHGAASQQTQRPKAVLLWRRGIGVSRRVSPSHVVGHHAVQGHIAGVYDGLQLGVYPCR